MLADGAGDAPLKGVGAVVMLFLGWCGSWLFWNHGPWAIVPFVLFVAVPSSGGGVAVGWYPAGMWLFVGL